MSRHDQQKGRCDTRIVPVCLRQPPCDVFEVEYSFMTCVSAKSAQTFKLAVEEGLELLARRNGSEPTPGVNVWDALDQDDPRNQDADEEGEEGGDGDAGLNRDIRPQVG